MRDEVSKRLTLAICAALAVLLVFWLIGMASTQAYEPEHRPVRRQAEQDVEQLRARLRQPQSYADEAAARDQARVARRQAQDDQDRIRQAQEVSKLTKAMEGHLDRLGASERLVGRLDVPGLARLLQQVSEVRARSGQWLPLGRQKAPYFLAAVAFHESSWRWRDTNLRGSRGEVCAFQVSDSAARIAGFSPRLVATRPEVCAAAAIEVMRICAERCGEIPSERWFSCYCTAGTCGAANDVVQARFETARKLLAYGSAGSR